MKRAQSAERRAQSVWRFVLLSLLALLLATPLLAQPKAPCTAVAARPLARAQTLAAEDVRVVAAPKDSALCALRSALLVGSATRRVVGEGEPLREPAIVPPNAVRSGEKVAVVWRDAGIVVRLAGTAANAAPVGGRVTVNVDARRRLTGVAAGPGLVELR